jgi:CheY-like chemotaxis protein
VRVTCVTDDAGCHIEVRDTGVGIAAAEQERVFEEFYQVGNPERDRRKGMGLGLSIVRRLADLLDLNLTMDSRAGEGTTFSLRLDRVTAPVREEPRAVVGTASLRNRQVLVIDDEASVRDALRGYLEGMGCNVNVAATVAEAAALAMLQEPDIVLADFRLRGEETGLLAIQRLRESYPSLPAIVVTGDTAPESLAQLDGTGIVVLHKPVVPARLLEAITALLPDDVEPAPVDPLETSAFVPSIGPW